MKQIIILVTLFTSHTLTAQISVDDIPWNASYDEFVLNNKQLNLTLEYTDSNTSVYLVKGYVHGLESVTKYIFLGGGLEMIVEQFIVPNHRLYNRTILEYQMVSDNLSDGLSFERSGDWNKLNKDLLKRNPDAKFKGSSMNLLESTTLEYGTMINHVLSFNKTQGVVHLIGYTKPDFLTR